MMIDERHMRHALALAARGLGTTAPNPSVGCVIVANGHVVGRGATRPGGRPHAETEALAQAGAQARGATAYVTLEPCSHQGQTGPCAQALIDAGVARVISAMEDPDPRVKGRGHALLKAAGIEVAVGVCTAEARELNLGFVKHRLLGVPMVTVKIASSLDARMALSNGESQWITGPDARRAGHGLRAAHDAILTGIGTVLADDPRLDCRLAGLEGRSPVRAIADGDARLPAAARLLQGAPGGKAVLLTATDGVVRDDVDVVHVARAPGGGLSVSGMLTALASRGITRLLVEAGPQLTTAFVIAGVVDRIVWFRSAAVLGGDSHPAIGPLGLGSLDLAPRYRRVAVSQWGGDAMETYAANA
jgi:diaminohydroxyphosphoribosylaminopyrimidine deaminase / 5-amino-6-(5-phosphoribosylamino)uracil reductase